MPGQLPGQVGGTNPSSLMGHGMSKAWGQMSSKIREKAKSQTGSRCRQQKQINLSHVYHHNIMYASMLNWQAGTGRDRENACSAESHRHCLGGEGKKQKASKLIIESAM